MLACIFVLPNLVHIASGLSLSVAVYVRGRRETIRLLRGEFRSGCSVYCF